MIDNPGKTKPSKKLSEIAREEFIIRPLTTTRKAIKITVLQRVTDTSEIALATASLDGAIPAYFEKPDLLEDMGMEFIRAAGAMRKLNKKVKNGN